MNQKLFQLRSFITYWLDSVNQHSLHSPFFFDLFDQCLRPAATNNGIEAIESLRKGLRSSEHDVIVEDYGAGSARLKHPARKIADIAGISLSSLRYSLLYRKLIEWKNAKSVVELGTSLGINSLYMCYLLDCQLHSFEGSAAIADIASDQFRRMNVTNATIVRGNIDSTLRDFMSGTSIDFAFMDANHRYEPTVRYFNQLMQGAREQTIIAIDDIHYSAEMQAAWEHIREDRRVYATADLYRCGLVFLDPSLNRQHFVLKF